MWADRSYNTDDGDVYKMMARLTVLTDMIGATPMFNCKSGKDRTGHLDAEVKMLASEIYYTHTVPSYGQLSTRRKEAFSQFALHSGNHQMQRREREALRKVPGEPRCDGERSKRDPPDAGRVERRLPDPVSSAGGSTTASVALRGRSALHRL